MEQQISIPQSDLQAMHVDENIMLMLNSLTSYIGVPKDKQEQSVRNILILLDSMNYIQYDSERFTDLSKKFIPETIQKQVEKLKEYIVSIDDKVDLSDMNYKNRKGAVVFTTQMISVMLKSTTKMPLAEIGKYCVGNNESKDKDHATVLYHIRKVKDLMEVDIYYRKKVCLIARTFNFIYEMIKMYEFDPVWAMQQGMIKEDEIIKIITAKRIEFKKHNQ